MKTIEEKARAYDEAFEKLRNFYRDYDTVSHLIDVKEELANLFPELVESEGEKIRKALVRFHKGTIDIDGIKGEDILAWLEKQGQKLTDDEMTQVLRTEYEKGRADAIAEMQKEWSEEDEHRIKDTIYFLETAKKHYASTVELDACINRLKSIKERYTWKPSDAQIRALEYIIDNAHNTSYSCKIAKELLEQLKKLKGE